MVRAFNWCHQFKIKYPVICNEVLPTFPYSMPNNLQNLMHCLNIEQANRYGQSNKLILWYTGGGKMLEIPELNGGTGCSKSHFRCLRWISKTFFNLNISQHKIQIPSEIITHGFLLKDKTYSHCSLNFNFESYSSIQKPHNIIIDSNIES